MPQPKKLLKLVEIALNCLQLHEIGLHEIAENCPKLLQIAPNCPNFAAIITANCQKVSQKQPTLTTNQNCHIFSSVNLPALSTRMCTSRCSQEQALTNEATEHHLSNVKTFFYIFNSTKIVLHLIALAYIYSTIQNQRLHLALIRTCLPHTHIPLKHGNMESASFIQQAQF